MTDEKAYARLLETLLDQDEVPSSEELIALSDIDQAHLQRFEAVWSDLPEAKRRALITILGQEANTHIELRFNRINRMALADSDAEVRRIAIDNLWESQDQRLIPIFLGALTEDPSTEVRIAAIRALGRFILLGQFSKIDPDQLIMIEEELLQSVAQQGALQIYSASIEALGYSSRVEVEEIINNAYTSMDESLRQSALIAMGRSANERWSDPILKELNSHSPKLRSEAAHAAGELELRAALSGLIELLEDVNDDVRISAIWSLGQIGGTRAREALEAFQSSLEGQSNLDQIEEALEHIAFLEGTPDLLIFDFDDEETLD
jgi:HEAT repeat protein